MDNRDLIIPSKEVVRDATFSYKQEKLWEVFPEEPLTIHASHFGTRSYLDSERVDEAQVTQDGELIPGSTPQVILGEYYSHEIAAVTEKEAWIPLATFSGVKPPEYTENSDTPPPPESITFTAIGEVIPEAPLNTTAMIEDSSKNLGILHTGVETTVTYKYNPPISYIKTITSPCDCARVTINNDSKEITIKYKPKPIPTHLRTQGFYTTIKRFEALVVLTDGTESVTSFSFEAKVTGQ